ncbi:YadA-like family protein [Salmonella enterica]|nr:hypothetical protein [Salmonella enterica]EFS3370495.1 hypothetical protein [Salmonella enterica]EGS4024357.1 hypothetical protein [Salmonella enterica]EHT4473676.1 YadA-like family protein [Salmonella enterica]EKM9605741.1 YadA-like family protein [Salmonella enterica]
MNKIYRIVWNPALQAWVAVSEFAKVKGKNSQTRLKATAAGLVGAIVLAMIPVEDTRAWMVAPANVINGGEGTDDGGSTFNVAIGNDSVANATSGMNQGIVAIGSNAKATQQNALALGEHSNVEGGGSTAIGAEAKVIGISSLNSLAIGTHSSVLNAPRALAIGAGASVSGDSSSAIGANAFANGIGAMSIGRFASATADNAVAIGSQNLASGISSLAIGDESVASGTNSIAQGFSAQATGSNALSIGSNSLASANTSMALGVNAQASQIGGLALGSESNADTASGIVGYSPSSAPDAAKTRINGTVSTRAAVSIGDSTAGVRRQITDLAAGTADTDAVNVAQLKGLEETPLTFAGNTGNVAKTLGSTVTIKGGKTTAGIYSDKNTNTVVDASGNLGIEIAENPEFVSILAKSGTSTTTLDSNSVTISGGPSMTRAGGIDAASMKIKNVQAGTADTDAVNVSQLKSSTDAVKTHYYSVNDGGAIAGNYDNDGATGLNSMAAGVGAKSQAQSSLAMGTNATATGESSIATGLRASTQGINSIALGVDASTTNPTSTGAVAIGWEALAENTDATALGAGAKAQKAGSTAIGPFASAEGDSSIALGDRATTMSENGIALGSFSKAVSSGSLALGKNTVANHDDDVALGSNSVTDSAVATSGTTIAGEDYIFAGITPLSTVSVGSVGKERTITNVAAGRISASSTDAINGSQLFASNSAINKLDEGAVKYDVITNPDGSTTVNYNSVTLGGDTYNSTTKTGGTRIKNVAYGVDGGDAVNVDQLNETVDGAKTHYYSVNDIGVAGGNFNNDGATGQNSLAAGVNTTAAGDDSVAVGYKANAAGAQATAIGANSSASGEKTMALGNDSTANGYVATAIGQASKAAGDYSLALGANSQALNISTVAIGQESMASSDFATAIGANSRATQFAATAMGQNARALEQFTAAFGSGAVASGLGGVSFGANSLASGVRATAIGADAEAIADYSLAVGQGAQASIADGVALGSGSVADTAAGKAGYLPVGLSDAAVMAINATTSTLGAVSVGDATNGKFRQITGVAAGTADSDAVNVAQLSAVSQANSDLNDRAVQYDVVTNPDGSTTVNYNSVTLGGDTYNSTTKIGGTRITNVARGVDDSDAVNMSQLNETNASVTNITNTVNNFAGDQSDSYTEINGRGIRYVRTNDAGLAQADAYANGQGSTAVGYNARSTGLDSLALGRDAQSINDGDVALGSGSITEATVATTGTRINDVDYDFAGINPLSTVSVGSRGKERTITNVAAGRLSASSTDAVNGSQLFATNSAINGLDKGAVKYDINDDGTVNYNHITLGGDTYNSTTKTGGTRISNVSYGVDPSDAVNVQQLTDATTNIYNNGTKYFHAKSDKADSVASGVDSIAVGPNAQSMGDGSIAMGDEAKSMGKSSAAIGQGAQTLGDNSVAMGSGAIASNANDVALGAGSVTQAAVATFSVTINGDTYAVAGNNPTSTVSVGSEGNGRTITNVAAGRITADSTDAVNGSELYATNQAIEKISGDVINLDAGSVKYEVNSDGTVNYNKVIMGGDTYDNSTHTGGTTITNVANGVAPSDAVNKYQLDQVDQHVTNISNGTDGMFQVNNTSNLPKPKPTGKDSTAGGAGAVATGDYSTSIGANSKATHSNSVALGYNSVTDRDNSVSVGSAGHERQITNVAAGTADTDAANVGQLKQGINNSYQYTNNKFNDLKNMVDDQKDKLSAGIAGAMAMAGLPQPYQPGASMVGLAGGTYQGESAIALGVSTISDNGKWVTKISGTTNSQGDVGAAVGVGYQF